MPSVARGTCPGGHHPDLYIPHDTRPTSSLAPGSSRHTYIGTHTRSQSLFIYYYYHYTTHTRACSRVYNICYRLFFFFLESSSSSSVAGYGSCALSPNPSRRGREHSRYLDETYIHLYTLYVYNRYLRRIIALDCL